MDLSTQFNPTPPLPVEPAGWSF